MYHEPRGVCWFALLNSLLCRYTRSVRRSACRVLCALPPRSDVSHDVSSSPPVRIRSIAFVMFLSGACERELRSTRKIET